MTIKEIDFCNDYLEKLNIYEMMKELYKEGNYQTKVEYLTLKAFLIDNAICYLKLINKKTL